MFSVYVSTNPKSISCLVYLSESHFNCNSVGIDLYYWCNFCMYTIKGVAIEQISIDAMWCGTAIPELESYFDAYM